MLSCQGTPSKDHPWKTNTALLEECWTSSCRRQKTEGSWTWHFPTSQRKFRTPTAPWWILYRYRRNLQTCLPPETRVNTTNSRTCSVASQSRSRGHQWWDRHKKRWLHDSLENGGVNDGDCVRTKWRNKGQPWYQLSLSATGRRRFVKRSTCTYPNWASCGTHNNNWWWCKELSNEKVVCPCSSCGMFVSTKVLHVPSMKLLTGHETE